MTNPLPINFAWLNYEVYELVFKDGAYHLYRSPFVIEDRVNDYLGGWRNCNRFGLNVGEETGRGETDRRSGHGREKGVMNFINNFVQ